MRNRDEHIAPSMLYMKVRQVNRPSRITLADNATGALV